VRLDQQQPVGRRRRRQQMSRNQQRPSSCSRNLASSGRELLSWEKDTLSSTQFVRLDDFFFSVVRSFYYICLLFLYAQFD
jgi:hypothetical protein